MNMLASWAYSLPGTPRTPLPRRRAPVQGVAARACSLAPVLGADADLLEAAAWLHDIGYTPALPLRVCTSSMAPGTCATPKTPTPTLLCRPVAHHSCAIIEVGERGLADIPSHEFEPAPYALSSVLTFCDMTTSPDSDFVPTEQRLTEICDRYEPGRLASRSIQRAAPMIFRAVEQVRNRAARIA
jgi:hypothetical protein